MRAYDTLMMSRFTVIAMLIIGALGTARGAAVSYSKDAFDADSDIVTNGNLISAVNLGSSTAITVNGVTFAADSGAVFINGTDYANADYYTGSGIGSLSQADTDELLDKIEYGPGAGNDLFRLSGLTVGNHYTIQMIYSFTNSAGSMYFAYSNPSGGTKSSLFTAANREAATVVTGTFRATETVQDLHVAYDGGNNAMLAGYQLRDIPHNAVGRENWQHTMTAGSFGLAFINNSGNVLLTDGVQTPTVLISGQNISRILAADITGSSDDELIYVADPSQGLYYYNFDTKVTSGPHGSGVADLTSVFWAAVDNKMSVIAATGSGVYKFVPNSFSASLGGLSWVMRGNFTVGDNTDEFIGLTSGSAMYTYDTEGGTWRGIGGAGHAIIAPGNIDTTKVGDEVLLYYSSGDDWYVVEVETSLTYAYNNLGGEGDASNGSATGDIDGNGVKGYRCGGGAIYRHSNYPPAVVDAWENGWAGENSDFVDLILADLDGNGKDEIYGIKNTDDNIIWKFADGDSDFSSEKNRGTIILIM